MRPSGCLLVPLRLLTLSCGRLGYDPLEATRTGPSGIAEWSAGVLATLTEYIRIPNKSPLFDPEWRANGHMARAVELLSGWAREHSLEGMTTEVVELEGEAMQKGQVVDLTPYWQQVDAL